MCPFEMSLKCNFSAFEYIDLVKFSKNLKENLKRRLRRRFGRFKPENLKTLQSNPPRREILQSNPPQGVRDPIISSASSKHGWIINQKNVSFDWGSYRKIYIYIYIYIYTYL